MKEFQAVFQLSKTKIFEVKYYTLSTNSRADFATTAAEFQRGKQDFSRCGQCQEEILKFYPTARRFFKKWDLFHLKELTAAQYDEMRRDMETLQGRYNYIIEELDETQRPYSPHFGFHRLAQWTKQEPKKVG